MKAFIHLGTEKTGTTSFQKCLHSNYQYLLDNQILYPLRLGPGNHRNLATSCLTADTPDDHAKALNLESPEKVVEFFKSTKASLLSQINQHQHCKLCVLSSEHFHSRLLLDSHVLNFRKLTDHLFEEITFYLHLRPQVDLAVSLASTATRWHSTVNSSFFTRINHDSLYYNYLKLFKRWKDAFPHADFKIFSYKSQPDFLKIFKGEAGKLSINLEKLSSAPKENSAIDVNVMAFVNAINQSRALPREKYRIDQAQFESFAFNTPLILPNKFAMKFQDKFKSTNEILCSQVGNLDATDLTPDSSDYPEEGNLHILDNKCSFSDFLNLYLLENCR